MPPTRRLQVSTGVSIGSRPGPTLVLRRLDRMR